MGTQFQCGIAKFDRKTERFQTWSLPPKINADYVQVNQVNPEHAQVDGKVWLQDAGAYTFHDPTLRCDLRCAEQRLFHRHGNNHGTSIVRVEPLN